MNQKGKGFKKFLPYFAIWFIACGIGFYFRLYPLFHYASNDSFEKASLLVMNNLKTTVSSVLAKTYPKLSPEERSRLNQEEFNKILHLESPKVRKAIEQTARTLDQNNPSARREPYLLASDSYYYYSLTENIARTGKIGDTTKGSKYLNPLMLAPEGHWEPFTLHPFVGFVIYKIASFFNPNTSLMYGVSFSPLVVVALALIPFLWICAMEGCSVLTSFIAAVYFLLAPILLRRSTFGWYDNDPHNTLFPFLIIALLAYGLKKANDKKFLIRWGLVCSLLIPLYALFWQGWVFMESVIVVSAAVFLVYNHFVKKQKSHTKNLFLFFLMAVGGAVVGVTVTFGFSEFFVLFQEGWKALGDFLFSPELRWPDLYIAVGELRKTSLPQLIDLTGGVVFCAVCVFGIFSRLWQILRDKNRDTFPTAITLTFFVFSLVMALKAQRFALLFLIPSSLFFAFGLENIFAIFKKVFQRQLPRLAAKPLFILTTMSLLALGLLAVPVWRADKKMPTLLNQIFNDTWEKTLTKIKHETPENSIINTWWPPGHFIKAIAKRAVTFDGATINVPQAYWLAHVLISPDERAALGILRMLNTSANQACDYLLKQGLKLSQAVELLKTITPLNQQQAAQKLRERSFTDGQITALLNLTHKSPPPSYLLLYEELIENNIQFSFVGKWDFEKVETINNNRALLKKIRSSPIERYAQYLWEISGGQPRYSGVFAPVAKRGDEILFANNTKINLESKTCLINSPQFGKGIPYSLLYLADGRVAEKEFANANLSYSALLVPEENSYNCVLMDPFLAKSLLMRLYFFKGQGLKYFEVFSEETNLTKRTRHYVFKVRWDKFLEDLKAE